MGQGNCVTVPRVPLQLQELRNSSRHGLRSSSLEAQLQPVTTPFTGILEMIRQLSLPEAMVKKQE